MPKNPTVLAMIAGAMFGCWPLLMNKSGLSPYLSAGVFSGLCFAIVLPFTLYYGITPTSEVRWEFALLAGLVGGVALLIFSNMLANVTPAELGSLFIITLIVQVMVPAIYQIIISGEFSHRRIAGIVVAIIAVLLLK